tara:strand:+ start:948 stop:1229 length:282 start_codon:yes stop_codon:yes gene_type:complete
MIGDIFGNIFSKENIISKGLSMAFGGTDSGKSGSVNITAPSTRSSEVTIETSTPPGEAQDVDTSDPETNLAMWQRRLFTNSDAYAIKVSGKVT